MTSHCHLAKTVAKRRGTDWRQYVRLMPSAPVTDWRGRSWVAR
nr:hypothetical protein [Zooshikella ganghwensis]